MGKLKQALFELEQINESLNLHWQLTDITDSPEYRLAIIDAKNDGYKDFRIYQSEDNINYVIVGFKNGAWEVHHADADGKSGKKLKSSKMAMMFVSTMFYIAKQKLEAKSTPHKGVRPNGTIK